MQISSPALAAFAMASLLAFGNATAQQIGDPSDTPITTQDCEDAWATAPASASCTTTVLEAENVPGSNIIDTCAVKANCAATDGGPHDSFSDYHGGPDGVATLDNCSGTLKPGC